MKTEKIKPTSSDLKTKAIVTMTLVSSTVSYDVANMVIKVHEFYNLGNVTYSHCDVIPLSKEQISKLSVDIPKAVVDYKFTKLDD